MKVHLKQGEIVEAITRYLRNEGVNVTNKSIDITFKAGRKQSGLSASVVIDDLAVMVPITMDSLAEEEEDEADTPINAEPQKTPTNLFN